MKGTTAEKHQQLYGLDFLRALAIIFVFIYHYGGMFPHPEWTNTISRFGWTGVDLFFVLSGYLIASQLFAAIQKTQSVDIKTFYLKRFFRIIPVYLLVVAIYFLFPVVHEREALAPLWKYISFTQNFGLDLRTQGTFSHAWSLCIEEQFYLLLPLLLYSLIRFKWLKFGMHILVFLFVLGFAARLFSWYQLVAPFAEDDAFYIYWYKWLYYPSYNRLDGLLVGVSLAAIFAFKPQWKNWIIQHPNFTLIGGIFVLTAAYFLCIDQATIAASVLGFPLIALGYGLLVANAINPTTRLYKLQSKVIARIAMFSYSIYLTHKIVIHLTQKYLSNEHLPKDSNWMFIICILSCLLVAWVIQIVIEKPSAILKNKILSILN